MLLLNGWLALLLLGLLGQTTLRLQGCWKRSLGGVSVEAANHGHPLDGKPWSVIITYRGSEDSQRVKDAWLAEALRGHLGAGKELGQAGSVHAWWGAQARARAPTQQRQGKGWTTAVAQA